MSTERGKGGEMSAREANEKAIGWQKKTGRDYHTGRKLPAGNPNAKSKALEKAKNPKWD